MLTITRKFEFDAGHRVLGHEGKCRHIHGHRYVAEVTVSGELDPLGRVIDFSVLKEKVGQWIDNNWDHNFLAHPADPILLLPQPLHDRVLAGKDPFIMPVKVGYYQVDNPTAENMARVLLYQAAKILRLYGINVEHVRIYETPNCWADASWK